MSGNEISSYCRAIESYLCQKNDGHLIRVVGPSFERVSRWAAGGVPLKIAFRGIDRYFERYYSKGPRRHPVKIDFCEADVLDVFDEWKRAVGITGRGSGLEPQARGFARRSPGVESRVSEGEPGEAVVESDRQAESPRRGPSLPDHLERVVLKLTAARAGGSIGADFDELLDRVGRELDAARQESRGLRGAARQTLIARLAALDADLLAVAWRSLGAGDRAALTREAEDDLRGFRATMTDEAFARARDAAVRQALRQRLNLPKVAFSS